MSDLPITRTSKLLFGRQCQSNKIAGGERGQKGTVDAAHTARASVTNVATGY